MTFSGTTNPTLVDLKNDQNVDGSIARTIEILAQEDEGLMNFLAWREGNLETGHRTVQDFALPSPTFIKFNQVSAPTVGRSRAITDTCGMMEDWSEIHQPLANLNGNSAAWRASQDRKHVLGLRHKFTSTWWYGNDALIPEEFTGLTARYNDSVASVDNPQAEHVIKGSGTPNTSIWLVCTGEDAVHGIYPKGSKMGLQVEDLGLETKETSEGLARVYRTHFRWDCGATVADWRKAARLQVDYSALTKDASGGEDLIDQMTVMSELVDKSDGRCAFFMGRGVKTFLRRQINNKVANSTLTMESVAGKPVMMFDGTPVYRSDSLLYTESSVS